ncbi:MAG TPA: TonB-dependent receptor, partial [Candidatus Lustribacter sp.]|nr:TonB-dependent receptor [Candidatus Lustribacter sp.]
MAVAALGAAVFAQSSENTGIIQITVKGADTSQPLSNARVFLLGPSVASALTTRSGIVKYTDVASGIYRVRINKPGYRNSTSSAFELLGNKEVDVDVNLALAANANATSTADGSDSSLKIIGKVTSAVTVSTHDVDEDSAVRRISDSLLDALNTVAGVDVTQSSNDPDSPQTISLHGHDESQTAVTLDGIPLSAPGTAANLRGINTDLFTGASASFGARAGALGGGVNFTTLQPTQTWQYRLNAADGSFDKYNWSVGATGSVGKLGIAVLTTKRGGNNPLTFQVYRDQSGFTYGHAGESTNAGLFLKLRYGLTDNTTLVLTALQNNQAIATLCTQFTGVVPCGIGPNNTSTSKYQFVYGTVQSLVGQVAVQVTGYVSTQNGLSNQINRYIDQCVALPIACPEYEPFATDTDSLTRGIASQATITKDNHTITFNGTTFSAQTNFTPLVATGTSTL